MTSDVRQQVSVMLVLIAGTLWPHVYTRDQYWGLKVVLCCYWHCLIGQIIWQFITFTRLFIQCVFWNKSNLNMLKKKSSILFFYTWISPFNYILHNTLCVIVATPFDICIWFRLETYKQIHTFTEIYFLWFATDNFDLLHLEQQQHHLVDTVRTHRRGWTYTFVLE